MSDYSKITNFLSKDSLSLNDPAKYVKGSEIDAEYNAIAVAVATKADTTSPTLVTPTLGVATATTINKITLTQPATGATLTLSNGKTLAVTHTLTFAGTDGTTMTFPATSATLARIDAANTFVGTQTFSGLGQFNLGLNVAGADFASRGITDSATATALTLSGSGANSVTIANSATSPTIGTSGGDLAVTSATGFLRNTATGTSIVYSVGGTGSGTFVAQGAAGQVAAYQFIINGVETARVLSNADGMTFATGSVVTSQVTVTHTASADRYITLTGANAANPKIATSAGSLDIGSPVVFTSQTVGTTVGAAGAGAALPATPLGYITTSINGTACKIPYYNT